MSDLGYGGKIISSILSIDFSKYIPIKKNFNEKTIVLIFDDFERCGINVVDLLGFINEYCENMKLKVILVANEEKINNNDDLNSNAIANSNNSYATIKEKIISRTIHYEGGMC